jgi:formylmethanofuran dehydrogenase subunit E
MCLTLDLGMNFASLAEVIPMARGKLRARLKSYASEGEPTVTEYKRRLMACSECDTLHERFYVRVERDDARFYETVFRCGTCRTLLIEPSKAIADHRCSGCGEYSLEDQSPKS